MTLLDWNASLSVTEIKNNACGLTRFGVWTVVSDHDKNSNLVDIKAENSNSGKLSKNETGTEKRESENGTK